MKTTLPLSLPLQAWLLRQARLQAAQQNLSELRRIEAERGADAPAVTLRAFQMSNEPS